MVSSRGLTGDINSVVKDLTGDRSKDTDALVKMVDVALTLKATLLSKEICTGWRAMIAAKGGGCIESRLLKFEIRSVRAKVKARYFVFVSSWSFILHPIKASCLLSHFAIL